MTKDRVLLIEYDASNGTALWQFLEGRGYEVLEARTGPDTKRLWREAHPDIAILDHSLPGESSLELLSALRAADPSVPVIILTAYDSIKVAIEAVKLGAEQFLPKPVDMAALDLILQRSLQHQRNGQRQLAENTRRELNVPDPFIGKSPAIRRLEETAKKAAGSESSVLIQGETGTGKGMLAQWLHQNGARAAQPFVDLNCRRCSPGLLETRLFGYERGFTGTVPNKAGLLEIAHKGTLFLDEIGDMDLPVQPRLLKVLEEKEFRRLGNVLDCNVNVRLISATQYNIQKMVQQRKFAEGLYSRINTVPLRTTPLRERPEDIPEVVDYLLNRLTQEIGTGTGQMSADAIRAVQSYSWPGNFRELRNVLEHALLLSGNRVLTERDLHLNVQHQRAPLADNSEKTLDQVERQYIQEILHQENGRVEIAAKKLGIPRSSLYYKLKQYGLSRTSNASQQLH